jgi:hypothetical protein
MNETIIWSLGDVEATVLETCMLLGFDNFKLPKHEKAFYDFMYKLGKRSGQKLTDEWKRSLWNEIRLKVWFEYELIKEDLKNKKEDYEKFLAFEVTKQTALALQDYTK